MEQTSGVLKLIIRGNLFAWTGTWHISAPTPASTPDVHLPADSYCYLVCVNDDTYLVCPGDRHRVDAMVAGHGEAAVSLDMRITDSQRRAYRLTGHGAFTDQQRLEQTLRNSEERFRLMAGTVPQILWITDGEGRVEFFNPQWTSYTGHPPPETAGEVAAKFLHPEDGRATIDAFTHALETQTAFRVEHRIRAADGTYRWFVVRAEPYVDPATGQVTRWFGASVDIHDRKLAQRELEEFNQQLERQVEERTRFLKDQTHFITSVVETIPDMLSVRALATGTIEYINHAPFTTNGFDGEKLKEMTSGERRSLVHPDDLQAVADYFDGFYTLRDEDIRTVEYRSKNDAGEWLWFTARGKVFKRDMHGTVTHLVSVVQNVTAIKKSEMARIRSQEDLQEANNILLQKNRALNALNDELNNFAFIASHDLREPLRKIKLFANLLLDQEDERLSPKGKELSRKIVDSSIRMNALIDEILTFSTLSAGDKKEKTTVNLNDIIHAVVEELRSVIDAKKATIACPVLPTVKGHALQLVQLFQNLLSNSIKFQKKDAVPVIEITTESIAGPEVPVAAADGMYVRIGVHDNGIGFEQKYADKIFEIFQRLNDARQYDGTGMGLAICKKVLQNHDGFITATGTVGAGASFYCFFPHAI
jgi:PAS domain S-box-containing protein